MVKLLKFGKIYITQKNSLNGFESFSDEWNICIFDIRDMLCLIENDAYDIRNLMKVYLADMPKESSAPKNLS